MGYNSDYNKIKAFYFFLCYKHNNWHYKVEQKNY